MEVRENCNGTKTYIYTVEDDGPDPGAKNPREKFAMAELEERIGGFPAPVFIKTDRVVARNSILWVDDMGHPSGKPINTYATEVYHSTCVPGVEAFIVGDCVLWPPEWNY